MKRVLSAERIYTLITLEGVPHFHVWLIPRQAESLDRHWQLIHEVMNQERSCSEAEAADAVARLRQAVA